MSNMYWLTILPDLFRGVELIHRISSRRWLYHRGEKWCGDLEVRVCRLDLHSHPEEGGDRETYRLDKGLGCTYLLPLYDISALLSNLVILSKNNWFGLKRIYCYIYVLYIVLQLATCYPLSPSFIHHDIALKKWSSLPFRNIIFDVLTYLRPVPTTVRLPVKSTESNGTV